MAFLLSPISLSEGASAEGTIEREGDTTSAESLVLYTRNGSALGGIDFSGAPQYINFEPGQTSAKFSVQSFADKQQENTESFDLLLYRAAGGPQLAETVAVLYDKAGETATSSSPPNPSSAAQNSTAPANGINVSGNTVNSGNTINSGNTTTNITNNYYTDNSNNYNNSFNTDNSVKTDNSVHSYSLSSVTTSNDYSIGKTISGNGQLTGTDANDLITGGKASDSLFGNLGNDKLIGGAGKDSLFGGAGSNYFNAGTSSARTDADRLYIQREGTAASADIIQSMGKSDRVYLQGATNVSVSTVDGGLGIFDNGILQAIFTGSNLNAAQLGSQVSAV